MCDIKIKGVLIMADNEKTIVDTPSKSKQVHERILLASPHMRDEGYKQENMNKSFDTNWIARLGTNVIGFEEELAEMVGIGHATALASGTAAIHLALKAVGVGQGDIVFCQTLTFSATVNPIMYEGAQPVFIDSEPGSWNMDPQLLE